MKQKLTVDEMIKHMKNKGITFCEVNEMDAKEFLTYHNYYMKLMSYRAIYDKHTAGQKIGQYINLDFGYMKELSIIDRYLRQRILETCLDIEHSLKTLLIQAVTENAEEDGYHLVKAFDEKNNGHTLRKVSGHKSSPYTCDLIAKYHPDYPVWAFVELISFGDLTYLCNFYKDLYHHTIMPNKFMNAVRDMRNAAGHNNCLLNHLFDKMEPSKQADSKIIQFAREHSSMKPEAVAKYLRYRSVYDFIVLLYVCEQLITSHGIKSHRYAVLQELVNNRMMRNAAYFENHTRLKGVYRFVQEIIDNLC